jgi:hypothetical protein
MKKFLNHGEKTTKKLLNHFRFGRSKSPLKELKPTTFYLRKKLFFQEEVKSIKIIKYLKSLFSLN